ncbi:MAG: hypothetical protein JW860_01885 [Sedimentisphaerales bacterium]|nr:hypothetical protein [Sedimentisphaerales bacterium]
MSRINTNVTALISSRILNDNTKSLNSSLEKLSTGLRINRGADDPAGLIASENLRKQIRGTETAIKNAERAINIIGTAEGSLGEINDMLVELQAMLGEAANKGGMSTEEIDANQLQVDSILNSIDRISNATEFEGIKLLNGNRAYNTSSVSSTYIAELNVNAAKLIDGATMGVTVTVTSAADTGKVYLSSNASLKLSASLSIQVGSNRGTTELTFAACATLTSIVYGINQVKEVTGVSAALSTDGAQGWARLRSVDFGTDAYVSVKTLAIGATMTGFAINTTVAGANSTDAKDYGVNARATINGTSATASGKVLTVRTAMLDAELELTTAAALSTADQTTTFGITGGGSDFALGALVDAIGLESIGLQNVASTALGNPTDGYLNTLKSGGAQSLSSSNLYTAQRIVTAAIKDVSKMRGRLGSFQKNTLEKTISSLKVTNENLKSAESAIRDTEFATETSALTRSQILVQASTNVLAQANFAPQNVLSLLG